MRFERSSYAVPPTFHSNGNVKEREIKERLKGTGIKILVSETEIPSRSIYWLRAGRSDPFKSFVYHTTMFDLQRLKS